jgi:Ca2+-binding RTX toxin-like protein
VNRPVDPLRIEGGLDMAFIQWIKGTDEGNELNGADEGDDFMYGFGGDDILRGFGRNDFLFGGLGVDSLFGGDGTDILNGGQGADLLDGGAQFDYADYRSSGHAVTVWLAGGSGNGSGGAAQGDTLAGVEGVYGSPFGDVVNGGVGNQHFLGMAGDDLLRGGTGRDWLDGGEGDDMLYGEFGDDLLVGGRGADIVDGGPGFDMAGYYGGPVLADMLYPVRNTGNAAGDVLIGIEGLYGGDFSDTLLGDHNDNTLIGNRGADTIFGRHGNDTLRSSDPGGKLYGQAGDDILQEGAGVMNGGPGKDWINVRISGNFFEYDGLILVGGDGADVFYTNSYDNSVVRIIDFEPGVDTLDIYRPSTRLPPGPLDPENFVLGTAAVDDNDHVIYDPATGRLWYDENGSPDGNDQYLFAVFANHAAITAADIYI